MKILISAACILILGVGMLLAAISNIETQFYDRIVLATILVIVGNIELRQMIEDEREQ